MCVDSNKRAIMMYMVVLLEFPLLSIYLSFDGSQSKIFHDYRPSRFLICLYTCYSESIPSSGLIQLSFLAARFQENGFVQGKVLGEHRGYEEGFKLGRQHGSRIGAEVSVC